MLFRVIFCITLLSSRFVEMVTRGAVVNGKGSLVGIVKSVELVVSETNSA